MVARSGRGLDDWVIRRVGAVSTIRRSTLKPVSFATAVVQRNKSLRFHYWSKRVSFGHTYDPTGEKSSCTRHSKHVVRHDAAERTLLRSVCMLDVALHVDQ